jgi:hypothetical protein
MKQNAEIFATQDYYEFVCFDRVRRFAAEYDELLLNLEESPALGLSALTLACASQEQGIVGAALRALRECGCNKRATRGATAHYRHDRDRVSVTVPDVTS